MKEITELDKFDLQHVDDVIMLIRRQQLPTGFSESLRGMVLESRLVIITKRFTLYELKKIFSIFRISRSFIIGLSHQREHISKFRFNSQKSDKTSLGVKDK